MRPNMRLADFDADLNALVPALTAVRHDLHRHPELGFEEVRTQATVRRWLEERGYSPKDCAGTGLVADLHPGRAEATPVALRADMDALPMQERTPLPYRSEHEGRAHKCGHDGHTTILMGVADLLARHRAAIPFNVRLLFQPAEEGVRGGGARVMVAQGALQGVREVYGLHSWPGYPEGEVRVRAGAMMAQVYTLRLTLTGKGGHGSQPQLLRDPVVAGAHLITALQTVVSRGLGYDGGAVVSVGRFIADGSHNVIPGHVTMEGTIRTFDPAITERVLARIRDVVAGVEATFGVQAALQLEPGYPVLMNDGGCVEAVRQAAAEVVGPSKVSDAGLPMAGGEDFAYFSAEVPGAYFFLGAQRPGEDTPVCHHPDFDFDDRLIPVGMRMFLALTLARGAA